MLPSALRGAPPNRARLAGSPVPVELLEHGGAKLLEGQPLGPDEQPDRLGPRVGRPNMDRFRRSTG